MQRANALNAEELIPGLVDEALGVPPRYQHDIAKLRGTETARLIQELPAARLPPSQIRRPQQRVGHFAHHCNHHRPDLTLAGLTSAERPASLSRRMPDASLMT